MSVPLSPSLLAPIVLLIAAAIAARPPCERAGIVPRLSEAAGLIALGLAVLGLV